MCRFVGLKKRMFLKKALLDGIKAIFNELFKKVNDVFELDFGPKERY